MEPECGSLWVAKAVKIRLPSNCSQRRPLGSVLGVFHVLSLGLAVALSYLFWSSATSENEARIFSEKSRIIAVEAPQSAPLPNQESINAALAMYGIEVPADAGLPLFDSTLRDRGMTLRGNWSGKSLVLIGPAAFDSWPLLGSTLAHELLVHCQQNFFLISLMDLLHLDGTGAAERQAYEYELAHSEQFHLSDDDRELVAATVAYYYPASSPKRVDASTGSLAALRIQKWLASQILPSE